MTYKQADGQKSPKHDSHPDPVSDEALEWFMRLQEDNSAEALDDFARWIASNPAGQKAIDDLARMQAMPSLHKATVADRVRQQKDCQVAKMHMGRRRVPVRWASAFAAAVILAGSVLWQQLPGFMVQWSADYITPVGARETFTLADGSSVTLNTASAIAVDFENGKRHVTLLKGEAYFDVKHDPNHPFVVAAHFSEVEVKGTAFSVFTDVQQDTVTLERGRVEITRSAQQQDKAMLTPGNMIVASQSELSPVALVDVAQSLSWREGSIIFRDRSFGRALSDLERYFGGKVIVVSGRFSDVLVNGNYRVADAEAAIRTLAVSVGADVTRLPGDILILR
ncbi:FecR domain-containing protein [Agrobacterium sp. AGB01]|uniref:FecR family protein n=1 Tax=Agrobacterium sp. AGB01 TaxID=2769302 RepID=UPI00177D8897|nr:FecR domain-containing protein [Agrobacterium sp. AGB01]MBD9389660.1 FecR domain-containing protein [Agrobacterium sp. AGB01]